MTKIAKAMLLGVLWVLLIVLLLFLLLLLRRKLIRKRREQKYQLEDINEAVCWIFADTAALMETVPCGRCASLQSSASATITRRRWQKPSA